MLHRQYSNEQTENHTVTLIAGNIKGTEFEYTIDKTLLWSQSESTDDFNRTITFSSIVTTNQSGTYQVFSLYDEVNSEDYNLTLGTTLSPLDSETYNSSLTVIQYNPAGEKNVTSLEQVAFNGSMTLSQLYTSLSKVAKNLAHDYAKADDESLRVFAERYATISEEAKSLPRIIRTEIPEFNKNILYSVAIIIDDELGCMLCEIAFYAAVGIGCILLMSCTYGLGYEICHWLLEIPEIALIGAYVACHEILDCESWGQPTYHYLTGTSEYEYYSYVNSHENLRGGSIDGYTAQIYCPDPPSMGQIIGTFDIEYVHGLLQVYGKSAPGGYLSDMYVYVSNDNYNWDYIGYQCVTSTSPY